MNATRVPTFNYLFDINRVFINQILVLMDSMFEKLTNDSSF